MLAIDGLFTEIFSCPNDDGQDLAQSILERNGYTVKRGESYVYAEGEIPVCLVAHTDVVHVRPPATICHDPAKHVVWSPTGLGADDRAGVYAIATILAHGLRPHVLFPDEEERGAAGATEAAHALYPSVHCVIELDRKGSNDAVTYQCDHPSWNKYLRRRGWELDFGTFTDIVQLMPAWGVCGVNLSVGYYNQHSTSEYLRLDQLERTIKRVEAMLRKPPRRPFVYREERSVWDRSDNGFDPLDNYAAFDRYLRSSNKWDNPH